MAKLLIVESPAKARSIQPMLGPGWRVLASMGHVRDLPAKRMGVDPSTLAPEYEPTERGAGVLSNLRHTARQCEAVYLATDPDREGEAIAWHIADSLRLDVKKPMRVTYHEITEKAIKAAIQQPRPIDMKLVFAQEARRVLDRVVGYSVSPVLCQQAGRAVSAGRVQTPALRLVVEREQAIRAFVATHHFGAELTFEKPGAFRAKWETKPFVTEDQPYVMDRTLAEAAAAVTQVRVLNSRQGSKTVGAPAPFTTSTLQQEASAKLGLPPSRTMELAQELFESYHAITYHRTDSVTLADDAVAAIRRYAQAKGYPLPAQPNRHESKSKNAQEAHEAIRPTEVSDERPAGISGDALALYELIHRRAVASQLAPMELSLRELTLVSAQPSEKAKAVGADDGLFRYVAKGRAIIRPGWTVLGGTPEAVELPVLATGDTLRPASGVVLELETEPPRRYTEATLVAELEKRGIGRPSTWAAILANILGRGYIRVEKKSLYATPLGEALIAALSTMRFAGYDYTTELEDALDGITRGETGYKAVVGRGWKDLQEDMRMKMKPFVAPKFDPTSGGHSQASGRRRAGSRASTSTGPGRKPASGFGKGRSRSPGRSPRPKR
ncbi:MAG: type I DNA topoisomerase [Sinobacteraceae bacterium]|nr:type I DNA topoisomerase [Nevskiaceae bacterium]